jgi:hypothetical protein
MGGQFVYSFKIGGFGEDRLKPPPLAGIRLTTPDNNNASAMEAGGLAGCIEGGRL